MKSIIGKLSLIVVLILSTALQCNDEGCDGHYYDYVTNVNGAVIFEYQYDGHTLPYERWRTNSPSRVIKDGLNGTDSILLYSSDDGEDRSAYEVRLSNGWSSTYNTPLVEVSYKEEDLNCPESEDDTNDYFTIKEYTRRLDSSRINMPPVFLHLTMSDLYDETGGTFRRYHTQLMKGKKWQFTSLTDDQGMDLTTHADWACMIDNEYVFAKEGIVAYNPGTVSCQGEDIPEYRFDLYVYFSYQISVENPGDFENPGEIKVSIKPSNYVSGISDIIFTIADSDFDEVSGTVEVNGRTANFVAQPE